MGDPAFALAVQIVNDVLALRGPDPSGTVPFRMFTVHIGDTRTALAKRFARFVPQGTGVDDVERVAAGIAPFLTTRET